MQCFPYLAAENCHGGESIKTFHKKSPYAHPRLKQGVEPGDKLLAAVKSDAFLLIKTKRD